MNRELNYIVEENYSGTTLADYLKIKKIPRQIIVDLKNAQSMYVNGTYVFSNHIINENDLITISLNETGNTQIPYDFPIDIVYEDEDIIILNKPPYMPTHPSYGNLDKTLVNAVTNYYQNKNEDVILHCINRLDKDTSGLTIIAKNRFSAAFFNSMVASREIKREYLALAEGKFDDDTGTIKIGIVKNGPGIYREVDPNTDKIAITHYEVIDYYPSINASLVKLILETGKTHQIRVHLKHIGHPIIGDTLYNEAHPLLARQALHAYKLSFTHPISNEIMTFEVPLPKDIDNLIKNRN